MQSRPALSELVAYNIEIVEQGVALASALTANRGAFSPVIGPHLRHIIEHYDALLAGLESAAVDYDHRARDRGVERDPQLAVDRLRRIRSGLEQLPQRTPPTELAVGLNAGVQGEHFLMVHSTLNRELLFVASHAVHHYALLRPALQAAGLQIDDDFGKAPSTVRHEHARS